MRCRRMTYVRSQRLSDVITAFFLPMVVYLCIHVSFLNQNLKSFSKNGASENTEERNFIDNGVVTETDNNAIQSAEGTAKRRVPYPLNNSMMARPDLLVFTAILRTGSGTLLHFMKTLKKSNEFSVISAPVSEMEVIHLPQKENQASVARKVSSVNSSAVIVESFAFVNFTEFGYMQPIQVTLVRDPLERAISWYYFARAPYKVVERYRLFSHLPSRSFLRKSLETCLSRTDDIECSYAQNEERLGHTVEFFCGHEEFCKLFGNVEASRRAKEVVEKRFAVVGVLEELEKTFVVLEHFVPRFFKGIHKLLKDAISNKEDTHINRNIYRPQVDRRARKTLKEKLAAEYEFYHFLRQRLHKQYEAVVSG